MLCSFGAGADVCGWVGVCESVRDVGADLWWGVVVGCVVWGCVVMCRDVFWCGDVWGGVGMCACVLMCSDVWVMCAEG